MAPGVVVADTDDGYDRIGHTWDQSHPNAVGEAMIAAAVADALATLDIGPQASRPIRTLPLGPRVAPLLAATPGTVARPCRGPARRVRPPSSSGCAISPRVMRGTGSHGA